MRWTKIVSLVAVVALVLISFQGCNTFRGIGKDLEGAGRKIQGK